MVQRTYIKNTDGTYIQNIDKIPLEPCDNSYLDGFVGDFIDPEYYSSLGNAFCLPLSATLE